MPESHIIAETDRLTIRTLTEADVPVVSALWADEEVTRFMGGPRDLKEVCDSLRADLAVPPLQLDLWPVVERSSGVVVGQCGLLPKIVDGRDVVELVYLLAAGFWARGYASEAATAVRDYAFLTLGITRLVSLIEPDNTASERVALKLGMKPETLTVRPSGRTMRVFAMAA